MIVIDIPMPANCEECPCSHVVSGGVWAGRMMCCALEARNEKYVLVREYAGKRPENCPIKLEIIK